MSGHSKWANIKHKKGKADAERGKIFTKIGREIAIAVRDGAEVELDLDQIVPSPAMKKIISAIDTMEIQENKDGNKTTVTIKYDSDKAEKPIEDDDEL